MPANDGRHGPKSRRTSIKTISIAAAAIGALALAACTSTTTSPPVPATPAAATGTGADSAGTLTGAGSTYVAPFFALAFARYHQQHPAVAVDYSPVVSSPAELRSSPAELRSSPVELRRDRPPGGRC